LKPSSPKSKPSSPTAKLFSSRSPTRDMHEKIEPPSACASHLGVVEPGHLYQPCPEDTVDAAVAEFANQPQNRLRRALFRRTGPGRYQYGARRAVLRLNPHTGNLEAKTFLDPDVKFSAQDEHVIGWTPIEEFARQLEREQSSRLRRARGEARRLL
jgi:hypothetical protein